MHHHWVMVVCFLAKDSLQGMAFHEQQVRFDSAASDSSGLLTVMQLNANIGCLQ